MAKSYVDYTADGSANQFNLTFNYLDASHVHVFVDTSEVSFTWVNSSRIQITAPAAGALVRVRRMTPTTPLTVYPPTSTLQGTDLTRALLQALYCDEENELSDAMVAAEAAAEQAEASAASVSAFASLVSTLAGMASAGVPALDILSVPPGSPTDSDRYLVGLAPTGLWTGHSGSIAMWSGASSSWSFTIPRNDQKVYVKVKGRDYVSQQGRWNKVLVSDERAAYQDFADVADGTALSSIVAAQGGLGPTGDGVGAAVITGGKIVANDNIYNVITTGYKNVLVSAEFEHRMSSPPVWCIAVGIGASIITKMVHIEGGLGAEPFISIWGGTITSPSLPYLFETDIPGGVTTVRGPGAYPVIGEKFRADVIVVGETLWVIQRNAANQLVIAKGISYWEVAASVGDYAYVQNNWEDAGLGQPVYIYSYSARPVQADVLAGLLPPLYTSLAPNAPIKVRKTLTSGVSTDIFKIPLPADDGMYCVNVDLGLGTVGAVRGYAGRVASWRFVGGNFTAITNGAPVEYNNVGYSVNSSVIVLTSAWSVVDNGAGYAVFRCTATKSGSDATNSLVDAQFTITQIGPDPKVITAL